MIHSMIRVRENSAHHPKAQVPKQPNKRNSFPKESRNWPNTGKLVCTFQIQW